MHHGARHEDRLELAPQCGDHRLGIQRRRHDKGNRPHHALGHFVGHPEGAVLDALDAVQVEVQVRQRAALAGHVDQVVGAAQQLEVACVVQLQHVGQHRGFEHVAARDHAAAVVGGAALGGCRRQAQRAQRLPGLPGGRAAARHLAGLGAAVDLDERPLQPGLGLRGQLRRQRRGGRQRQRHRRQRQAREQQRLQVEGRGHQGPRLGQGGQRVGDVGRVERAASVETGAAQQRQQHRALQAVAVLRRHRAQQREALQRGLAQHLGQAGGLGLDVRHQRAPALEMRLRRAGGAAGEQAHRRQLGRDQRHLRGRRQTGLQRHGHALQAGGGRRNLVDQQVGLAAVGRRLAQGFGQRVRRHQAGLPAQQRRGQADGEVQPVLAQVDGPPGRQPLGQGLGLGQELAGAQGLAAAPGQRRREVARAQQRLRGLGVGCCAHGGFRGHRGLVGVRLHRRSFRGAARPRTPPAARCAGTPGAAGSAARARPGTGPRPTAA